jgi:hypothetical protein
MIVLLALAAPARADEVADAPPPLPRPTPDWMMTVGGMVRSTARDGDASKHLSELDEYGYTTKAAAMGGVRGDLSYQRAPIVDLGVAWAWARGTFAKGPLVDDPDQVTGRTLELGAFARVHWVPRHKKVAAEPRLEVGVSQASVALRGATRRRVGLYTKIGLDVRLGVKKAGVVLSVDYTAQHRGDDMDLDVPTGGVTFGASFYWRRWN